MGSSITPSPTVGRPPIRHDQAQLREDTEECLRRLGVPAFAGRGIVWRHGRIVPLLWMIAFEVGAVTYEYEPLEALLVGAPVVAFVAFLTLRVSAGALGIGDTRIRWLLLVIIVLPVAGMHVFRLFVPGDRDGPVWYLPPVWSDAAVMLVALYAAAILLLPQARPASPWGVARLWLIFAMLAVAVPASFVTAPLPFPPIEEFHSSFYALLTASVVLTVVLTLPRTRPRDRAGLPRGRYVPTVPAAILMILFGVVNGLLLYRGDPLVEPVTGGVVAGVMVWVLVRLFRSRRRGDRENATSSARFLRRQIDEPSLRYWLPFFLLAFPLLMYDSVDGLALVATLFVFNALYLLLVWVLAGFGIDYVIFWAAKELWRKKGDTGRQMAEAAPLLLIFVLFFALTAETWQVMYRLTDGALWALYALLASLTTALVLGWSINLVLRERRFGDWEKVVDNLTADEKSRNRELIVGRLRPWLRARPPPWPPHPGMRPMPWLNALLVLFVYQLFILGAVGLGLFVTFLALVWLAVPPEVAAVWILGDGSEWRAGEFERLSLDGAVLDSPWLRVSMFLTLFAVLYFTAQSLATRDSRKQYFAGINIALRRRFAIRHCHQALVQGSPPDQAGVTDGDRPQMITGR